MLRRLSAAGIAGCALSGAVAACGSSSSASSVTNPVTVSGSPSTSASGSPTAVVGGQRTVIVTLGLNVRDAPGGNPLGVALAQGAVVTVLDHSDSNGPCNGKGGWFKVKGETVTGWIADCPEYSSPHRFNLYQSDQRGFSALYYDTWTFAEQPDAVIFRPQSGQQTITVSIAASLDALGPPGRSGYSVASADTILVYGVTGLLRLYDRTGSAALASPGAPASLDHLAEYRATIDSKRAIRIHFNYVNKDELQAFRDFYNSVIFPPPATPTPSPH